MLSAVTRVKARSPLTSSFSSDEMLLVTTGQGFTSHSTQNKVISEMLFPANLLTSTEKTKSKPGEQPQKYTIKLIG